MNGTRTVVDGIDDPTAGELFQQVAADVGNLVSTQIALAKLELREEAQRAGRAAKLLGVGAAAGVLALLLLSMAAAWGLAELLDSPGLGFLIVGALYAVVALVLLSRGRDQIREVNPIPEETISSLKEDFQWARRQAS